MVSRKRSDPKVRGNSRAPARTPEERENQLIDAAVDLAEQQLRNGQASAQVITHYLKLGSTREKLEQKRLQNEVALLETKREVMEAEKHMGDLIQDALKAMQAYSGNASEHSEIEYDDYER